MDASVIIATYNRAAHLEDTLLHLAQVTATRPWEVVVVDNNSPDETPEVVRRLAGHFPVPLRYLHEPVQGKYGALNKGIQHSRGRVIAATDDDARVAPDWLDRAQEALEEYQCAFVGGPVRPLWDGKPPAWLDAASPTVQKVIAICDYGTMPREFGVGTGWPLGVNVAYRRDAFDRVGLFDPSLGRTAGTLRSQSQREWHLRARAAGLRGFYIPGMVVEHRVSSDRLEKRYFRRWQYWHGISRASLYSRFGFDPEEPERVHHRQPLPEIGGVPRYLFLKAVRSVRSWLWRLVRRDAARAFEFEMWLCFFAGLAGECRRQRHTQFRRHGGAESQPVPAPAEAACSGVR